MAKELTEENAFIESVNTWIHGIGFVASIPAGIYLASLAGGQQPGMLLACVVYSISLAGMYFFSALSHWVADPAQRHRMRSLDQGTIYLLIAGTFTPFILSQTSGWLRIGLLVFVWIAAAAGFYSKVLAKHRINNMTSIYYVLMGWIPASVMIWSSTPLSFGCMLLGGLFYTGGVLFLQNDHKAWYFHPLWHVMVVLASIIHYLGIAWFAVLGWDR
jgi:hemolysin III